MSGRQWIAWNDQDGHLESCRSDSLAIDEVAHLTKQNPSESFYYFVIDSTQNGKACDQS